MKKHLFSLLTLLIPITGFSETNQENSQDTSAPSYRFDGKKLSLTDKEWKERLTPEQYRILRKGQAEMPYNNTYCYNTKKGTYVCAGCELALFSSDTKYDSGTGWPTFFAPIHPANVSYRKHKSYKKVEIYCSKCDGHLGDIFNDGPPPTWQRLSIDSTAMKFIPRKN